MVLSEQQAAADASTGKAHPFSRIMRVASTYSRLVLGFGAPQGVAQTALDALATMRRDTSGWLDGALVDLLINLLRAFPPGTQVVLKSGHYAVVSTPLNRRWDRPIVRVASKPPTSVDLMAEADGKFVNEVLATQSTWARNRFKGRQPPPHRRKVSCVRHLHASSPTPPSNPPRPAKFPPRRPCRACWRPCRCH